MGEISKISWTDGTVNFWEGCEKISEGCAHCYAENRDQRFHGGIHWGRGAPRKKSMSAIQTVARLNRMAEAGEFGRCRSCGIRRWTKDTCCGHAVRDVVRPTMFSLSLGDFLDAAIDDEWRAEALTAILDAESLDWMLLSKRPEAFRELLLRAATKIKRAAARDRIEAWLEGEPPQNVAFGATIESAKVASARLDSLSQIPAVRRFISAEPLLSGGWADMLARFPARIFHLVIAGGESGAKARPMYPGWVAELETVCDQLAIPFHFKQWGEWMPDRIMPHKLDSQSIRGNALWIDGSGRLTPADCEQSEGEYLVWRAGKKLSGNALDPGMRTRTEHLAFPTAPWRDEWWKNREGRFFPSGHSAVEWSVRNNRPVLPLGGYPMEGSDGMQKVVSR